MIETKEASRELLNTAEKEHLLSEMSKEELDMLLMTLAKSTYKV